MLTGAFAVLDAVAHAEDGIGLTALVHATGLAKTSAYRLAEQLVKLGAAQRVDHRYYIGSRLAKYGKRWQPDPILRRAARDPIHNLAAELHAAASMCVLDGGRIRIVTAAAPRGRAWTLSDLDRDAAARTATGRVLYGTQPHGEVRPGRWTPTEWQQLRDTLRNPHAIIAEHRDPIPDMNCVAAPVWHSNGHCAGAVSCTICAPAPPPQLPNRVLQAARQIERNLTAGKECPVRVR
ncbi:IclR family transcriptional regulator [Mycobacterium sp. 050134]|uniref:IclR family transcriptional regulator n=1 Tax=Mycobacterium sp. 050134 TaxID=3096111 RepID=UPI002EDB4F2E